MPRRVKKSRIIKDLELDGDHSMGSENASIILILGSSLKSLLDVTQNEENFKNKSHQEVQINDPLSFSEEVYYFFKEENNE